MYYSVLDVTPTTDTWTPAYIAETGEIVKRRGGKYLARTTSHEQIEGHDTPAALRIILEWSTKKAALDFMKDPDYIPHLKAKTDGSISHHYLIEAKDELA